MDEKSKAKLKLSLTEFLDKWFMEGDFDGVNLPWLGDNVSSIMATAALSVLEGMVDGEIYMREQGYLKD